MTIQVTSAGVVIDTLDQIKSDVEAQMRLKVRDDIDTTPDSTFGQIIGVIAEREYTIQQKLRDVDAQRTAQGASAQSLTNLALLAPGTIRRLATFSTVTATINLNAGVTVPAGSEARVPSASVNFSTLTDVTNGGALAADFTVELRATQSGPIRANAGTLTEIVTTSIVGWNTITNPLDASLGQADETDAELRVRRISDLQASGAANIDAIKASVVAVQDVLDAKVISDDIGHTTNVIVWDGETPLASDDAIAQAIWNKVDAGIPTIGALTGTAVDADGQNHTLNFDRASQVDIYCIVYLTKDSTYPADGDAQVVTKVVDFADANYKIDHDVIVSALIPSVFEVQGVTDVTYIAVGLAPSPIFNSNIGILYNQIALFDSTRTSVVST
jgi:hypothetical protein